MLDVEGLVVEIAIHPADSSGSLTAMRKRPSAAAKCDAELSEIALVDVVLPTGNEVETRKRCISQPTEHQRILLQRLGNGVRTNPNVVETLPCSQLIPQTLLSQLRKFG
jgi:hypothetical protein